MKKDKYTLTVLLPGGCYYDDFDTLKKAVKEARKYMKRVNYYDSWCNINGKYIWSGRDGVKDPIFKKKKTYHD